MNCKCITILHPILMNMCSPEFRLRNGVLGQIHRFARRGAVCGPQRLVHIHPLRLDDPLCLLCSTLPAFTEVPVGCCPAERRASVRGHLSPQNLASTTSPAMTQLTTKIITRLLVVTALAVSPARAYCYYDSWVSQSGNHPPCY